MQMNGPSNDAIPAVGATAVPAAPPTAPVIDTRSRDAAARSRDRDTR